MIDDIELEKEVSEEENNDSKPKKLSNAYNELRHLESIEGIRPMAKQSWRMKERVTIINFLIFIHRQENNVGGIKLDFHCYY